MQRLVVASSHGDNLTLMTVLQARARTGIGIGSAFLMAQLVLRWTNVLHGAAMDVVKTILATGGIGFYLFGLFYLRQNKR